MIEKAIVVFPQPDSPTMPIISPSETSNDTSSTAFTIELLLKKYVVRFWTSSSFATYLTNPSLSAVLGFNAEFRPSPTKTDERISSTIPSPGKNATHHEVWMNGIESRSMPPQLTS